MELSNQIQSFIQQVKDSEQRELLVAKERIMREKIIPFNQEIDKIKAESIDKLSRLFDQEKMTLTKQYNDNLIALQQKFDVDKQIINDTAEKKKTENENAVMATETYEITNRYKKAIAKLNSIEGKE